MKIVSNQTTAGVSESFAFPSGTWYFSTEGMGAKGSVSIQCRLESSEQWHNLFTARTPALQSVNLPACSIRTVAKGDGLNLTVCCTPIDNTLSNSDTVEKNRSWISKLLGI